MQRGIEVEGPAVVLGCCCGPDEREEVRELREIVQEYSDELRLAQCVIADLRRDLALARADTRTL